DDHSDEEHREIIVGHSTKGQLMMVCFTERAAGVIRIINARPATKKERENYERNVRI
ncbi:MAG: BrnT family toxin, partial [Syntrophales bacterium]